MGPLRLRETPAPEWVRQTRDEIDSAPGANGPGIRCAACSARLADPEDACDRAGAHHHRLRNPAGIVFDVLLFARAAGCRRQGAAVRAHSWFPPARWTVAGCAGCGAPVGWFFDGSGPTFVGLIRARIRIAGEAPGH
jgi:hypothetical protein